MRTAEGMSGVRFNPADDVGSAHRARLAGNFAAALEERQRRYTADLEPRRSTLRLVLSVSLVP